MNWKKFLFNRYTIFYILWAYFLILWSLPRAYIGWNAYNAYSIGIFALSNLVLTVVLPIYSIVLIIKDFFKKHYITAVINVVAVVVLVFVFLYLRRLGIEQVKINGVRP